MKSIKEKQILVKWAKAMNEPIDPALVEEVERYNQLQQEIKESIRSNTINDLFDASKVAVDIITKVNIEYPKPPTLEELLSIVQEESNELVQAQATEASPAAEEAPTSDTPRTETVKEEAPSDLISRAVHHIHKEVKSEEASFQQPQPTPVEKNFNDVQKKLKFLEQAIGKIAATGPGGGAVNLKDLDDVNYTSVVNATDGQALTFNAANTKWEATTLVGGGVEVDTLATVTNRGNVTTNGITVRNANANFFAVNTSAGYSVTTGQIAWNAADLTFDMGMANGVTLQVGQEQYIKVKAGSAISDGQAVMFAGADGEHVIAVPNDTTVPGYIPEWFIGIATQDLAHNAFGYITTFGKVHNINTLAWSEGDILYADPLIVGGLVNTEPQAPYPNIVVAAVTKRAGGDGHILVRPTWRSDIHQLNDVQIISPSAGQVLTYQNNLWHNRSITSANVAELTNLYFTNARVRQAITVTGAGSYDNTTGVITINTSSSSYGDANTYSNVVLLNYITNSALSGYATNLQLASYATTTNVALKSNITDLTTANVTEVSNLYFTNARVYSNVTQLGYITSSSLSGYATNAQLTSYATTSNLALKANINDLTTGNVTELTNLYFTNARVYTNVTQLGYITSSSLSGYATNSQLATYATTTNVALKANIVDLTTANVIELTNLYFTNARTYSNVISIGYATNSNVALKANVADLKTANVAELTNLYFTNARATAAVTNTSLSNITIGGQANVTYQPAATVGAAITVNSANTVGGTGYADFLRVINSSGGTTNPNKTFRLTNIGTLEIINSAYSAVSASISDGGNFYAAGTINSGAYSPGQVIKDIMLSNSEVTVSTTTVATSTADTDFISYSYTPVSSSSYLIIHVHVASYDALSASGTGNDSYFSRIKVGGNEITYSRQATRDNYGFRTGPLFPLTGRYTNSDTSAKTITVGVRRDSADDNITIVNSATALWMRITEIAR